MAPSRLRPSCHSTISAMASPTSPAAKASPGGSRIGRPPQWTVSRSRKLARLYVYTTLSIEKIIRVLEDDVFKPRKNSGQKTINKMLDNDPRYLHPDSRQEMNQRVSCLCASPTRSRGRQQIQPFTPHYQTMSTPQIHFEDQVNPLGIVPSSASSSSRGGPSFSLDTLSPSSSFGITEGLRRLSIPMDTSGDVASDTGDDGYLSPRDIQRRLSDCSIIYATQVSTLLRKFSIASASDSQDQEQEPQHGPSSRLWTSPLVVECGIIPAPGHGLPGDFLKAHKWNCTDLTNAVHATGRCWCSVARETSTTVGSWFLPSGQLSEQARLVLANPAQAGVFICDHFGNTPLHLIASLEGCRELLFRMVVHGANTRVTNEGRQTFLHVLHEEWFSDVSSPSAPLTQLLDFLRESTPDLLYERDLYGRTFLHHAHLLIRNPEVLTRFLSSFNPVGASRRDAFGFNPLTNAQIGSEISPMAPQGPESISSREVDVGSSRYGASRPSSADDDAFIAYHARLVEVIQSSYNDAQFEDAEGRNGLHCLAEAIINNQLSVVSAGRTPKHKHKSTAKDTSSPNLGSTSTTISTTDSILMVSGSSSGSNVGGTLQERLRYLEALTIRSAHPVDINHYDKNGNTVLMAFITHISDDQDDKSKTLMSILETLIHAGVNIEARNRLGETALLVAARLGRKMALTTLLENGANVYARDVEGRGVLKIVDETCLGAKGDVALYARLEACRVLLTGRRDWGVVMKPNAVLEWAVRGVRS